MKTLLNDILATILALVISTTLINSHTAFLVSKNTSDIYAQAVNADAYKATAPAFENGQSVYL